MRETAPTTGSIGCTSGYPSANRMMPSDTNKFRPHPRDHIIGMDLQNPSAFLDRFRVFLIRRKQEDEVIGQFAIAGVTSNQPSQFVLLLRDPGFISRIKLRKVVVSHVTQFRLREAATTPDGALHTPNNTHKEGVGSSGQIRAAVWYDHIVHKDCPLAPRTVRHIHISNGSLLQD